MSYFFTNLLPLLLMVFEFGLGHEMSGSILDQEGCVRQPDADHNCIIECKFSDDFIIDANSLPQNVSELSILQGSHIQFDEKSFSKIDQLRRVVVRNVQSLKMKRHSFLNLSSQSVRLEINGIARVEIQRHALYLLQGPITMLISQCNEVIIEMDAIPWIQELNINGVAKLQLKDDASVMLRKPPDKNFQYSTRRITLIGVNTDELPANSFPSSTKEITISACNVQTLRKNSISAIDGENITIANTNIDVIESEAFKFGSYFKGLILLKKVNVNQLQSRAILSAGTNFSVINSSIQMVHDHAFSMTMKNVLFDSNNFTDIKTSGIDISIGSFKTVTFTNNTLRKLSTNAIEVNNTEESPSASEFVFEGNIFDRLENYSLHFKLSQTIPFKVSENIFLHPCDCGLRGVFSAYIDSEYNLIDTLYNDSCCTIASYLSKCFHNPESFMKISEYVRKLCEAPPVINCPVESGSSTPINPNIRKAIDIQNGYKLIREHQVIFLAILVACAGILATVALTACLWFGRHKHNSRECHFSDFSHHLRSYLSHFMPSNPMVRSRSSTSITRVPVHDYAEVLPPKYVDLDEDTYICIDKATQTLPEELTQELLQTLRDKLDDSENYREARCMIEHLYELIKVEENCNHNLLSEDILADLSPDEGVDILTDTNENMYDTIGLDVLQQRRRRKSRNSRKYVHRGTRAPSPDKLLPPSYTNTSYTNSMRSRKSAPAFTLPRPTVTEYMQPVDHQSSDCSESHYDYASISSTLDVADRRSTNSTASTRKLTTPYSIGPSILTEYKDPCDVKVPIYTQLDDMIQQPLPLTPLAEQVNNDLGDVRGTRL